MGRRAQGFTLRPPRTAGACWTVYFTLKGQRPELSTGERDESKARRKAREIYEEALHGGERKGHSVVRLTKELTGAWLDALALRPATRTLYEKYSVYWLAHLPSVEERAIAAYFRRRLKEVRGKSARSELSAFRGLLSWLVETGELEQMPATPRLTSAHLGTPYKDRRRVAAPELTRAEVKRVIAKLPEKSPSGFWVRPRCEFLYESGLRPTTVDALSVPEHWAPGSRSLNVTDDVDKEGFARELPLSKRALVILARCSPKEGLIFGPHRYDPFVRAAALLALPAAKARLFTGQHLRSARATHLLDAGGKLTGVQFLLGHRNVATTARYVRPSKREAEAALKKISVE